jgi:hypothetical protein
MTFLLDIASLAALLLVLTFVPALGIRHDAKISRQIRKAEEARSAAAYRV